MKQKIKKNQIGIKKGINEIEVQLFSKKKELYFEKPKNIKPDCHSCKQNN